MTEPGADALADVERVVAGGGEADDVVREVVAILHERLGRFVRLSFVEEGTLVAGLAAGGETATASFPVRFQGVHVADLEVGGDLADADRASSSTSRRSSRSTRSSPGTPAAKRGSPDPSTEPRARPLRRRLGRAPQPLSPLPRHVVVTRSGSATPEREYPPVRGIDPSFE